MRAAGLAFNSCCQSATKPDPRRRRGQTEIQQCATKMMRGPVCLARGREKRSGQGRAGARGSAQGPMQKRKARAVLAAGHRHQVQLGISEISRNAIRVHRGRRAWLIGGINLLER